MNENPQAAIVNEVNQEEGWVKVHSIDEPVHLAGIDSREYDADFPTVGMTIEFSPIRDAEGSLVAHDWKSYEMPPVVMPPVQFSEVAMESLRVSWELAARNDPDKMDAMLEDGWEPFSVTQLPRENAKVWFRRVKRIDNELVTLKGEVDGGS